MGNAWLRPHASDSPPTNATKVKACFDLMASNSCCNGAWMPAARADSSSEWSGGGEGQDRSPRGDFRRVGRMRWVRNRRAFEKALRHVSVQHRPRAAKITE
eukprot:826707-Pyramimonas_sp.AAC.1